MIRTQVYIPEPIHQQLAQRAEVTGIKMARLIRDFIVEGLERTKPEGGAGLATLEQLAQLSYSGGPEDLSTNLDDYLYGETTDQA
jgi:hypothetical protein